jgi:hypothetical protein
MSTETIDQTDERTELGQGPVAHIVKDPSKVAQAYLDGTPLEALCGHVFTPSRSVKDLPICQMCKEMADAFMDGPDGGSDRVEGVL